MPHIMNKPKLTTPTAGYAMLEVLISILVIAFGLLGLAGLQGVSLLNNHSAYQRNQVTLYTYDIIDRIRANRAGFNSGYYNLGTAQDNAACHPSSSPTGCTSQQLAGYDLYAWNQTLQQLPNGQGIVCIDSTPDDGTPAAPACDNTGIQYAVKIWWSDDYRNESLTQLNAVFQP